MCSGGSTRDAHRELLSAQLSCMHSHAFVQTKELARKTQFIWTFAFLHTDSIIWNCELCKATLLESKKKLEMSILMMRLCNIMCKKASL